MSSGSPHALFPFTRGYAVWAGACAEANPALLTPPIAPPSVVVPPGGTIGPVDVRQPRISLTVKRYSTSTSSSSSSTNVSGGRVVIKPEVPGCTRTIILTTNGSGVVTTPLPYGSYSICAQEGTGTSPARRVTVTRVNQVANGTNFNTAYAPNATPPATAAVMLPFTAQSPSQGQCPG